MTKNKTIKTDQLFLPLRLAAGAGIFFLMALGAYAQATLPSPSPSPQQANEAAGTAEAERVIVTGSNIPTAEEVGPNPVLNINRDLINKSGQRSAEALLKNLPVANANGVPLAITTPDLLPARRPFHCAVSIQARHSCLSTAVRRRRFQWARVAPFLLHRFELDPARRDREHRNSERRCFHNLWSGCGCRRGKHQTLQGISRRRNQRAVW